ncbi:MAG: hypothetical protein EHM28_05010 [Spirochaetaceae bacterium]|nr:MAG: hypothetical protein EHM28_05010 [Spirochaetaceae bacterium]
MKNFVRIIFLALSALAVFAGLSSCELFIDGTISAIANDVLVADGVTLYLIVTDSGFNPVAGGSDTFLTGDASILALDSSTFLPFSGEAGETYYVMLYIDVDGDVVMDSGDYTLGGLGFDTVEVDGDMTLYYGDSDFVAVP